MPKPFVVAVALDLRGPSNGKVIRIGGFSQLSSIGRLSITAMEQRLKTTRIVPDLAPDHAFARGMREVVL